MPVGIHQIECFILVTAKIIFLKILTNFIVTVGARAGQREIELMHLDHLQWLFILRDSIANGVQTNLNVGIQFLTVRRMGRRYADQHVTNSMCLIIIVKRRSGIFRSTFNAFYFFLSIFILHLDKNNSCDILTFIF